ncbi:hypothetical protein B0H10DRAFT_1968381 [Mycena sp. CBHHK59/15]|nr:hypothetical protein B0H10DRAFT_1968381 [Mycena sp. CBHHK59/15]
MVVIPRRNLLNDKQAGAGPAGLTPELYDILVFFPDFQGALDRNISAKRMYALPGGTKVVKELLVTDWVEPGPLTMLRFSVPSERPAFSARSTLNRGCWILQE